MKKMMKTSLGASKKHCDAAEEQGTSEVLRDIAGLEKQQAEPERKGQYEGDVVFHLEGDSGPCGHFQKHTGKAHQRSQV